MEFITDLLSNSVFYVIFFILSVAVGVAFAYDIFTTAMVIAKSTMYGTVKAVDNLEFKFVGNVYVKILLVIFALVDATAVWANFGGEQFKVWTYGILFVVYAFMLFMYAGKKSNSGMTLKDMQEKTKELTKGARNKLEKKAETADNK